MRLAACEALEIGDSRLFAERERRESFESVLAEMLHWQSQGQLSASVDVGQFYLSMLPSRSCPAPFPAMPVVTGYFPGDPRFRRDNIDFLRWLGARVQASSGPGL